MRKSANIILGLGAAALIGGLGAAPSHAAGGVAPGDKVCNDKANPPADAVIQGGCVVIDRRRGNCMSCHMIPGVDGPGNVAPPLVSMKQRFPDRAKLRTQVWDATALNKNSVMPPFGRHKILTEDEIDKVVDFLLTL
jgi:sulfur-oxidizing protein SoxX